MIDDCLPYVEQIELFQAFTPHERNMLASVTKLRHLDRGDLLCREGDPGDSLFVLAEGRVALEKALPDGTVAMLYTLGPGRVLGQVSLIDGGPRSITIYARDPSVVLEYPRIEFERHFRAGSRYCFKLLDIVMSQLSEQLRDADQTLSRLNEQGGEPDETLRTLLDQILESAGDVASAGRSTAE